MPKNLTSAMREHLDEETTRLAAIWRITRKDGLQFFFTDHDRDIVVGGDTYRADAGFERTAIRSDAGFAVDNLDLVGVVAGITHATTQPTYDTICRDYRTTATIEGRRQEIYGTACRQPDGSWQRVS